MIKAFNQKTSLTKNSKASKLFFQVKLNYYHILGKNQKLLSNNEEK